MVTDKTEKTRWQSIAENWLMAELKANAGDSEISVWDAEHLSEIAKQTLGITKSKRSWERFLAGLPFLQVSTAPGELLDDVGRPARSIVIGQLISEAQQARRPVRFLAIHCLDEISLSLIHI